MDNKEKVRENYFRRAARRQGFVLRKSRSDELNANNLLGWMTVDFSSIVQAGEVLSIPGRNRKILR